MPLPGGPADKSGNRYEIYWTIYCIYRLFQGEFRSIRFEPPGQDKAEFWLANNEAVQYHQAKRQHEGNWTLKRLFDEGILNEFQQSLEQNSEAQWKFISGSPAPSLEELTDRARQSASLTEFREKFIKSKKYNNEFQHLVKYWGNPNEVDVYSALKQIEVYTINESTLRTLNTALYKHIFPVDKVEQVISALFRYIFDNIHQEKSANDILLFLSELNLISHNNFDINKPTIYVSSIEEAIRRDIQHFQQELSKVVEDQIEAIHQDIRNVYELEGANQRLLEFTRSIQIWDVLSLSAKAKVLCLRASIFSQSQNYDLGKALALLDEADAIQKSARANRIRAFTWHRQGKTPEAIDLLEGVSDIDSRNLLASLYLEQGSLEKAKELINYDQEKDANEETKRLYALIALRGKEFDKARDYIEHAHSEAPKRPNIRFLRAKIYYLSAFSSALPEEKISPLVPQPIEQLYVIYNDRSKRFLHRSEFLFRDLADESENSRNIALIWILACLANNPEKYREASDFCQDLLNDFPEDPLAIIWGITSQLDIDLTSSMKRLEELATSHRANIDQISALAEIYLHQDMIESLDNLLDSLADADEQDLIEKRTVFEVERLLLEEKYEDAFSLIENTDLSDALHNELFGSILLQQSRALDRWEGISEFFLEQYKKTSKAVYFYHYCRSLHHFKKWEILLANLEKLNTLFETNAINYFSIEASFHARDFTACLNYLNDYREKFFFAGKNHELELLFYETKCLENTSRHVAAIECAHKLVSNAPQNIEFKFTLTRLYYLTGNHAGLELMAKQFLSIPNVDIPTLLTLSDYLVGRNNALAVELFQNILEKEIPDELTTAAYIHGIKLGFPMHFTDLAKRFHTLVNSDESGFEAVHMSELPELLALQRERITNLNQDYFSGMIPVHLLADYLNILLVEIYVHRFMLNSQDRDQLHEFPIMIRHGSRQIIKGAHEEIQLLNVYLDITSIMLAKRLGILGKIETLFEKLFVAQSLMPKLSSMISELNQGVHNQQNYLRKILGFVRENRIKVVDLNNFEMGELRRLQGELREDQIKLLNLAKASSGYLLSFTPLRKPDFSGDPADLDEEAEGYVLSLTDLVGILWMQGKVAKAIYDRFMDSEKASSEGRGIPLLQKDTPIFSDGFIILQLEEVGLLEEAVDYFDFHITKETRTSFHAQLDAIEVSGELSDWVQVLIDHINIQIEAQKYILVSSQFDNVYSVESNMHLVNELMSAQKPEHAVLCIEDRYFSSKVAFNGAQIIGINELLYMLLITENVTKSQYYDFINQLRAANARVIPLEADELIHHLRNAPVTSAGLHETPELSVIRKSVAAYLLQADFLQISDDIEISSIGTELVFIGELKLTIHRVLSLIWQQMNDVHRCHMCANWVLRNLYLDYIAYIEFRRQKLDNFAQKYLTTNLAGLVLQHVVFFTEQSNLNESLGHEYFKWLWDEMLKSAFERNSDLLPVVCEQIAYQLTNFADSFAKNSDQELVIKILVHRFLEDVPSEIESQLMTNHNFVLRFELEAVPIIHYGEYTFFAEQFWVTIHNLLAGQNATLKPLNSDSSFSVEVKYKDNVRYAAFTDGERTYQIMETPVATSIKEELTDYLRKNQHWFEYTDEGLKVLCNNLLREHKIWKRAITINDLVNSSAVIFYEDLVERVRMNSGKPVDTNLLLPPSISSLMHHLRMAQDQNDFLLDSLGQGEIRRDILKYIIRYSAIPRPLPEQITHTIREMSPDEQEQLIRNLLKTPGSPISRIHLIRILNLFAAEEPIYKRLARYLVYHSVTNEARDQYRLFRSILQWSATKMGFVKDVSDYSLISVLLSIWLHSHYMYSAFVSLGVDFDETIAFFNQSRQSDSPSSLNVLDLLSSCELDISHPNNLEFEFFTVQGLAHAYLMVDQEQVDKLLQLYFGSLAFLPFEDSFVPHPTLHKFIDQAEDSMNSFLKGSIEDSLQQIFGENIAKRFSETERDSRVEYSIERLREGDMSPWPVLAYVFGNFPIIPKFFSTIQQLIIETEATSLIGDWTNGASMILLALNQVENFNSNQYSKHLEKLLLDLSEHVDKETSPSGTHTTNLEDVLLFGLARLTVKATLEGNISEIVSVLNEILYNRRVLTNQGRLMLENMITLIPDNHAIEFWELLLKLRATGTEAV